MPIKPYDYLIVGSGLFGAVFAFEMKSSGKKCLVIDKRAHRGGNIYCDNIGGINVHKYGAHIFHTNDEKIWNYVNGLVKFNSYINSPLANCDGKMYNLPFNMNTFSQLWGITTPADAERKVKEQTAEYKDLIPANLEEQALSLVGRDIYHKFIKGYSEKQWGRPACELPAFLIKRLPLRFRYDNNYFDDKYQGIPVGGYNTLIDRLLMGIECRLSADYQKDRAFFEACADKIVYTGRIDEYFHFSLGKLEYRSLKFLHEHLPVPDYQGNAVVNYPSGKVPFTRIIEHKHFEGGIQPHTVITREFPCENPDEPYYPFNDEKNNKIYMGYKQMAAQQENVIFGGRLAEFKYYDMHQVVASALKKARAELHQTSTV
ncbi:MAG TPA: UDP-galactopyranose mutase [Puia sp.]